MSGHPYPRIGRNGDDRGRTRTCPVREVVEVEQDSRTWLANMGAQPIRIEGNEEQVRGTARTTGTR